MVDKVGGMVGINHLTQPLGEGTVFVVQEVPGRNILSAEKFGKLELLLFSPIPLQAFKSTTILCGSYGTCNTNSRRITHQ